MQKTDKQAIELIKTDFELHWCSKVQQLTQLRRSKISQSEIAFLSGRSIKTIQRFESYKSKDAELMYIYREILK